MILLPQRGMTQSSSDEFHKVLQAIESLKAGQKALSDDVQEIKKLLASRGSERSPIRDIDTMVNIADAFAKGDKHAKLTLVEFIDYQ